jgi:hypothetical protein
MKGRENKIYIHYGTQKQPQASLQRYFYLDKEQMVLISQANIGGRITACEYKDCANLFLIRNRKTGKADFPDLLLCAQIFVDKLFCPEDAIHQKHHGNIWKGLCRGDIRCILFFRD